MRVYVVESSPEQIREQTARAGPITAFRISKRVSLSRSELDGWQRVMLSYDLWYSDYGGTANIDIFARALGKQTVVLVFMYEDPRGQIVDVVNSFRWHP